MGRSLRTDIYRPDTCPKGHKAPIHINRYSRWTPEHQKIQYACLPKGQKLHKFTMAMPSRQPTHVHPLGGQSCQECERPYLVGQGPSCGHQFMFTVREQAKALMEVGVGHSIRSSAQQERRNALRPRQASRGHLRLAETKVPRSKNRPQWSKEGNIVADAIDLFAPVVLRELREAGDLLAEWPTAIAVDSFSLRARLLKGGAATPGGMDAGEIFGAFGGTSNRDMKPVALQLLGGKDHQSALDFFATLNGAPTWVVADFDAGLELAVRLAWPNAIRYMCEGHILRLGQKAFKADKLYKLTNDAELARALEECQHNPEKFEALVTMVAALEPSTARRLRKWISDYSELIHHQMRIRSQHPSMPRSVGALEELLEWVDTQVAERHGGWRNLTRVNHVLSLMLAHRRLVDGETKYLHFIRGHLDANGGATGLKKPSDYKRFRDRPGASSLRRLIKDSGDRALAYSQRYANSTRQPNVEKRIAETNRSLISQGIAPIKGHDHHRRAEDHAKGYVAKGKKVADFPTFKAQWHPRKNGNLKPEEVAAGTDREVWWLCPVHPSHEWKQRVCDRINKNLRCRFCTNRQVSPTNSLAGTRPDLAQEWHAQHNAPLTPNDVIAGADRKVWWRCRVCEWEWQATLAARSLRDAGCPRWRKHPKPPTFDENDLFGELAGEPPEAVGEDPDLPF